MNRINKKLKISMFVATIILFAISIICAVILAQGYAAENNKKVVGRIFRKS